MELRDALRTTGAVRRFRAEGVDDATVVAVLDDARFAPSGGNRQGWRVAVVKDPSGRAAIATLMQPVWDQYVAIGAQGRTPYAATDSMPFPAPAPAANELLERIQDVPVVLAVAVDLARVSMMDTGQARPPITGGGSIYPFCWSILLAARERGLGGVMTTFLSRVEDEAGPGLGLPADHALAATIFLGVPEHQPTRLSRRPVRDFATVDRFDGPPFD